MSHFSKLLSGFLGNKRGPAGPVPPGGEPIELRLSQAPHPVLVDEETVQLAAGFSVRAADKAPRDRCEVMVSCALHIQEDEKFGSRWPVTIQPVGNHGFTKVEEGGWTGTILKSEVIEFEVRSDPYPNVWTASLVPTVLRTSNWSDQ